MAYRSPSGTNSAKNCRNRAVAAACSKLHQMFWVFETVPVDYGKQTVNFGNVFHGTHSQILRILMSEMEGAQRR